MQGQPAQIERAHPEIPASSTMGLWTSLLVILISRLASTSLVFESHKCPPCKCSVEKGNVTADCTNRSLTEIPPSVPPMTSVLLFAGNKVTLKTNTFKNLPYLKVLDLRRNNLTYTKATFPSFVFQNLTDLVFLKINDNNVESFNHVPKYPTEALEKLESLEWLSIDGLEHRAFDKGFSKLKRLARLSITSKSRTCNINSVNTSTFKYLPFLDYIEVVNCNLREVEPGTFVHQKRLKTLDVSQNHYLKFEGVTNATHEISASLEKLIINEVVPPHALCVVIKDKFCRNLEHTHLVELHAENNRVSIFNDTALQYLPKTLKIVYMTGNRFEYGIYIGSIASLTGLEEVYLGGPFSWKMPFAHISELVQTSTNNVCNDCENLLSADTPGNQSSYPLAMPHHYPKINIPRNLRIVSMQSSQLYYHIGNIGVSDNNITEVILSRNLLTEWNGQISGLEKLEKLDISRNIAHKVGLNFFPSFKKLKHLNVSHNLLGRLLADVTKGKIFRNLNKLQTLDLSNNFITKLPPEVFTDLFSLTTLDLSSNSIQELQFDIVHMKKLKFLNCSCNQVQRLQDRFVENLDKISNDHNITMDLSENPIACTCHNLHFLSWMVTSRIKGRISFGKLEKYHCVYDDSHKVSLDNLEEVVRELEMSCYSYSGFFIGVSLVVFVCLSFLTCSLLYRFRWKLRYIYYAARHRYSTDAPSSHEFVFDAFVSFAEEDREFVVSELLVKLEDDSGMKLNFHQRDFIAGCPIAHNIIKAVKTSKRTLVILSRHFLKSSWCVHELQMAHMESVSTGRDVLLIIMMEHIPTNKIPVEILYHIQSDSYLEYPLEGEKDVFWGRLIASLKE